MTSAQRVLWGIGTPRTMRAHWALHELSLPYETRPVRTRSEEISRPEFLSLNARQKIPLLQDGEFVIAESAAIIAYLAETYADAETSLVPKDRHQRARWMEWCFFIMTELDAAALYVIRRHRGLTELYGDAPAAVASAQAYFSRQLEFVNSALDRGSRYLMGEQFTTADILLSSCLVWASAQELPLQDGCLAYLGPHDMSGIVPSRLSGKSSRAGRLTSQA